MPKRNLTLDISALEAHPLWEGSSLQISVFYGARNFDFACELDARRAAMCRCDDLTKEEKSLLALMDKWMEENFGE